jgi:hypothetical protein
VAAEAQKAEDEKRAKYEADRPAQEARIAALPVEFQDRIYGFCRHNSDWSYQFEAYELFTCEQAVLIASALKTPGAVTEFSMQKGSYDVPGLSDDHSGNTFGAACHLAAVFLHSPELLFRCHGAMCPLVGCKEYGCWSART